MSQNNPDLEMMRTEVFRIGAKMDALPQLYVPRIEHDLWRKTIDQRLDEHHVRLGVIESDGKVNKDWEVGEHQKLVAQFDAVEDRLSDKIEAIVERLGDKLENQQQNWFSTHNGLVLWLVTLAIGILEYVLNFMHK